MRITTEQLLSAGIEKQWPSFKAFEEKYCGTEFEWTLEMQLELLTNRIYRGDLWPLMKEAGILPVWQMGEIDVLRGLNLEGVDLSGIRLFKTNLSGCNLRRSNLTRTFLFQAVITNANLEEANLSMSDLRYADLSCSNMCGAYINGAIYNKQTTWPPDFDANAHGCLV